MTVTVAVDAMGATTVPPSRSRPRSRSSRRRPMRASIAGRRSSALEPRRSPSRARARREPRARSTRRPRSSTMDEPPADALRRKKDSSMRVAINLVKDGAAQACVSAGNTGALMAIARFVLKTLPGHRPAGDRLAAADAQGRRSPCSTSAPTSTARRQQLVQFARDGQRARRRRSSGIDRPTVGLLNIGEEDIKGNERRQGDGGAAASVRASTSTATSKATTSTRARPTSSSATASSATSR